MVLEAILLGLSTGTYCTMNCAPVLIPFLAGTEEPSYKRNAGLIGAFLGGRLVMYCVLGAVFAAAGLLVHSYMDPVRARQLSLYAYLFCGLSLLLNSLGCRFPWGHTCRLHTLRRAGSDWVTAVCTGLAVGLHVCPPLWTALVRSVFGGHGLSGLFYFIFFYAGTLPFFLPLLGIPFVTKRLPVMKRIARIAQFFMSLYFTLLLGLVPILFG
ncbi:MAG: sulfite exporter TauE/SafE family protein [Treponema sp.]|nr:sulfite exporter TauE/SafE family protein [Treponema sp.]